MLPAEAELVSGSDAKTHGSDCESLILSVL